MYLFVFTSSNASTLKKLALNVTDLLSGSNNSSSLAKCKRSCSRLRIFNHKNHHETIIQIQQTFRRTKEPDVGQVNFRAKFVLFRVNLIKYARTDAVQSL